MSKKYGHFIDTRRGCGWNIHAEQDRKDGYGIYSMSKGAFSPKHDLSLCEEMIHHSHCKDAYSYCVFAQGEPMLAAYHKRTVEEQREADKANADDCRSRYISEWLTGDFDRYAFEYIGSPFWKNIERPIADFYMNDEPMPLEEPIDADSIPTGNITREQIMKFAADGRIDAIRAAVWALLRQYDLPEAERKFVVIRDAEEEVRKWIAAIGYCLPIRAANEISFNTCMADINQEPKCCYYIQKTTGAYIKLRNIQDPNQERRWFYMLAGADPMDSSSSRTASPMMNAPYLVIDGASKQAKFETDSLMMRAYMKDLIVADESIQDFCNYMNEMKDIHVGTKLCELYEAKNDLTNEDEWSYTKVCKALAKLMPHFTKQSVLMRYAVTCLCVEGEYQARFVNEDETNGLRLLGMLLKIANAFGITEAVSAVRKIVMANIVRLLGNPREADKLSIYTDYLKSMSEGIYKSTIHEIVKMSRLNMVNTNAIASADEKYVLTLFDIIAVYLDKSNTSWSDFFKDSEFAGITDALINKSLRDQKISGQVLQLFKGDSRAIDGFILKGCSVGAKNSSTVSWWQTLLQNQVSVEYLCELISSNNIGAKEIESVLCTELRINGCSEQTKRLFKRYIARTPGIGNDFYREWIKCLDNTRDKNLHLRQVLSDMACNTNFSKLLTETLNDLDKKITMSHDRDTEELVDMVNEYAVRTRTHCENVLLWKFLDAMSSAKISRYDKDGIVGIFLRLNAGGYCFKVGEKLFRSELGEKFMERMQEYVNQPAVHIIMLGVFEFKTTSMRREYAVNYAKTLCKETLKRKVDALASVFYLREVLAEEKATKDTGIEKLRVLYNTDTLVKRLDELLAEVEEEFSNVRMDNAVDRVILAAKKEYGRDVSMQVEQMLNQAQENYRERNRGQNIFTKIINTFRR